ncbi:T9SS type A sorting domain-containing protein [Prevotella pallens]|uniref:T9SS type A sorting domain-containing protein n=1 Tax=Prevotella pallens TaxID=60133 RepID=UPI0028EB4251|nr:T9SS type A sorting domain-containing protein [Prevotella pallens]
MKLKTKLLLTLVVVLLGSIFTSAYATKKQQALQNDANQTTCIVVKLQDGGENIFFLGESPKLMNFADSLAVIYKNQQLNFALKDIKDYHFEERNPAGIKQTENSSTKQGQADFTQGIANFTQYPVGSRITVFTLEGRRVAVVEIGKDGTAQLDMRNKPAGVYIVNTGKQSFKWLKK